MDSDGKNIYILNVMFYPQLLRFDRCRTWKLTNITYYDIVYNIITSIWKENPVEILVNSREMALELSYFTLNMYTGKKKQNFRNHIVFR